MGSLDNIVRVPWVVVECTTACCGRAAASVWGRTPGRRACATSAISERVRPCVINITCLASRAPAPHQDPVWSWRPGQLLFVATSIYRDEYENQNEVAAVQSVSSDGRTIVLDRQLQYSHYGWVCCVRLSYELLPGCRTARPRDRRLALPGAFPTHILYFTSSWLSRPAVLLCIAVRSSSQRPSCLLLATSGSEYQTEVGLLSRSITFQSWQGSGDAQKGAHVKIMGQVGQGAMCR